MSWADYSDDEKETVVEETSVEEVGFAQVKSKKTKDIKDEVLVFSDAHDYSPKNFRFVATSQKVMHERIRAERFKSKNFKWWHGYQPANQQIIFKDEEGNIKTEYASVEYQQEILAAVPKQIAKQYLIGKPGFK